MYTATERMNPEPTPSCGHANSARQPDRDEDDDQPAQPRPTRRVRIQARLQCLDGWDRGGPAGGLGGCRERHEQADREGDQHGADAERGRVERDRPDRPDERCPSRAASAAPAASPATDPATPSIVAWTSTKRVSWLRVTPAARSSPSSRIRSVTVIESVLKIRNAPDEQRHGGDQRGRRPEVRGRRAEGRGQVLLRREGVWLGGQRHLERGDDLGLVAPSPTITSTRLTPSMPSSRCAVTSGTTTVRPPDPTNGPSPARIPWTSSETGRRRRPGT